MNFILAVTTYNRIDYLKDLLRTWDETANKEHTWSIIIADDGSNDGTLEYVRGLTFKDTEIILIKNERRGVHFQVNQIIAVLNDKEFDVAFKVDDDILFLKSGWEMLYYDAMKRTGYDHLCYYNPKWKWSSSKPKPTLKDGLESKIIAPHVVQGCFYTITKRIIKDVGYFDTKNFGLYGFGHIDYTFRCCRAGYNNLATPFDVENSNEYIGMQLTDYKSAIPDEIRIKRDTPPSVRQRKLNVAATNRLYIGYNEISDKVDG